MDWTKTAFVFPGQGSQTVGMGKDFAEVYSVARETFEQADDVLSFALSRLCFDGPADDLNDTINTQPALYVTSIAILRALHSQDASAHPAMVAGHSLGEFTALTAAGALDFDAGLRLVRERGRLMKEAGEQNPGAMAALLGLDVPTVQGVVERAGSETGRVLVLANDNCPGQVVISGEVAAVEHGIELAQAAGAKRAVRLAVSIASHSPLMGAAADQFRAVLADVEFAEPTVPVYGNVYAGPVEQSGMREELAVQMTQSVRWTESVGAMIAAGAETFVEIGSGDVLTGLLRRIDRQRTGVALSSVTALRDFIKA